MNHANEPLDRLFRAASNAEAMLVDNPPFGWEAKILRAVREQGNSGMAAAFATLWRRGFACAFATAVMVASVSAWNMNASTSADPERLAMEPVEIYQALK
ncbi:MAG TPA: hypothetical protein VMF06_17080 [Candidatus Limnocylindria bacterium]|nr:hypothetical protein [Candidatus Limnocylindria bacterium]